MPASLVVQQIDDVVAFGPPDGKLVEKFDKACIEVADKLGVVLASRDDPEKSFAQTQGVKSSVFGMILARAKRLNEMVDPILANVQQENVYTKH